MCITISGCHEKETLVAFPVPLEIEIRELYHQKERQLGIMVKTLQEYECLNYGIEYEYTYNSDHRIIEFKSIFLPSMCITALGPAKSFIYFGVMEEGKHEAHFKINGGELITDFRVSKDKITVIVNEDYGNGLIGFTEKSIIRLSDDYIWGYLVPETSDEDFDYNVFLDHLRKAGAQKEEPGPGNYGFFRITDEEVIIFDHDNSYKPVIPFICTFDGEFESLKQIADMFSNECLIIIYSARGDYYRNQQ